VAPASGSLNGHAGQASPLPPSGDGDPAAVVFADLSAGKLPVEIVAERRLSPDFVKKCFFQWQDLRRLDPKLVLPAEWVLKLKDLEARVALVSWDVLDDSAEDYLVDRVRNAESQIVELEALVKGDPLAGLRETFVCSCGEKGQVAAKHHCTVCGTETSRGWLPNE
jgi:hypothetical protein